MNDMLDLVMRHRIVAIARRVDPDRAADMGGALLRGGVGMVEVTFDQADPDGIAKSVRMIEALCARWGDALCVGAGTVMTAEQARAAASAGARFALAPNVDEAVIAEALRLGLAPIPGAMTPTEVARAHALGAPLVKLFPAGDLGPNYVKALRGPMPHIPLMAVGGIERSNLAEFLRAGCAAVGIGSSLVDNRLIAQGKYDELEALAKSFVDCVPRAGAD